MRRGYLYLTAVIDWFSRYVLAWRLSNSMDVEFCLEALDESLQHGRPEIFNTDQGSQFTSKLFTQRLEQESIAISMDGKGRCLDNIPIERFWRTLKVEEVYLNTYETVQEARDAIGQYIEWYNHERRHSGIDNHRPIEVMLGLKHPTYWSFKQTKYSGIIVTLLKTKSRLSFMALIVITIQLL